MDGLRGILKSRQIVNTADASGNFPLHLAVSRGDSGIVEYLVGMGADLERKNPLGKTALRLAVDLNSGAMVALLAGKGASLFIADDSGVDACDAALRKGPELISSLLTKTNVRSSDSQGRTVLHRAADSGLVDAVRIALGLDPDVNRKDAEGRTALDCAFLRPQNLDCAKVAELIVQKGGTTFMDDFAWFVRCARDGEYASRRFEDGNSPLHEAVARNQRGYVQFLLAKRVDPDAKNSSGQAPLHEAVRSGYADCVRLLLQGGADPNVRDLFDNSPLLIGMPKERRSELLSLLLSNRADPDAKDKTGNGCLHIAAMLGYSRSDALQVLQAGARVDSANSDGNTPLMLAVLKGNLELAGLFAEWKANVFAKNGKGESPLAAAFKKGPEATAVLIGRESANIRDDSGGTPLMLAIRNSEGTAIAKYLIDAGADVNARSNSGDAALHLAVSLDRRDLGELLLAAGADVFVSNMKGELPVTLAFKDPASPRDWIITGQTIRAKDGSGDTLLHYAARLGLSRVIPAIARQGADVDSRNANGETALHAAVKADAADSAAALVALGSSPRARDAMGNTPLHLAVQWNAVKSISLLSGTVDALDARNLSGRTAFQEACRKENFAFINLLLERKSQVDARDGSGMTALMEAVQSNRIEVAKLLLQKAKADVSIRDDSGTQALALAVKARNAQAVRLLLDAGADIHARNAAGETPFRLCLPSGLDGLKLLIDSRNVNAQDHEGRSPLHIVVAESPAYEAVSWLCERGAKVNSRDMQGDSPLHLAVRNGQYEAAALLVKFGADAFARNAQSETPLGIGMKKGRDALKALVGMDNSDGADYLGNNALHYAAQSGDADAASYFLSAGADKSARNLSGETPSDIAAKRGFARVADVLK
jgi:ankyrin repeat protein